MAKNPIPSDATDTVDLTRSYAPNGTGPAGLLLEIFGGNEYYAMARTVNGEITYQPVKKQLTESQLSEHLLGKVTLGAYQLEPSNKVRWLGWDVDSTDRAVARSYALKIVAHLDGIPHVVEFSGSKGYHILVFLEEPMDAETAKAIVDSVRESEGLPATGQSHVECYPKQAALTKSQPYGNLLKIPLGVHPKTHDHSRFVDVTNGWENGKDLDPLETLGERANNNQVVKLLQGPVNPKQHLADLIRPYWIAGERHNLSLYLAGYLAQVGWAQEEVVELIELLAEETGDTDIGNRMTSVRDTFASAISGKRIKGLSGLADTVPQTVLNRIIEAANKVATPPLMRQLDSIRLGKGPMIEKIRISTRLIWNTLNEGGEIIQTPLGLTYWYEAATHLLWPMDSLRWEAILHRDYGLNPRDGFSSQVIKALSLQALNDARIVEVRSRTAWLGDRLLVNLGGAEVYVLDGKQVVTSYNGECGYMFTTGGFTSPFLPAFDAPIDVWQNLVSDISFNKSDAVTATPAEQAELLKAWILSYFFQELLPTRPLLVAIGAPGSGKTTALRRILRLLESPDSEVMELVTDKPDALRASLSTHHLIILDNLEKTNAPWLVDMLNRLSTGAAIELRQLYKTNETYSLKPNCFIGMTAVTLPFSEETIFSRLLPIEMAELIQPLPEYWMQQQFANALNGIWADLLNKLNRVVYALKHNDDHLPPISSRLADFSVFCKRIVDAVDTGIDPKLMMSGLRSLVDRQRSALVSSSPFISVLEEWLSTDPEEAAKVHTWRELWTVLEPLARQRKLNWRWDSAASLSRHVVMLADSLKRLYAAEFISKPSEGMVAVKFKKMTL